LTPRFFSLTNFDPNFQILHSPIFRSALPIRGRLAGGLTPAFFLQTANPLEKGHGFSRFSGRRNAVCDACLPKMEDFLSPPPHFPLPIVFVWCRHTRSTLRDNRVQREQWGNYTILVLKAANSGLSVRVSDNRSLHGYCHSYHCKEKKAHSLYNYQVIYNLLLCYIIYILLFT